MPLQFGLPPAALNLLAAAQTAAAHHHHGAHHSPMPHWLLHLGLPGLFVISLLDACPIPLPIPGSADLLLLLLVAQRGSHPFWLLLATIIGSVLGGYTTWKAGEKGGQAMLDRWAPKRLVKPLTRWVSERGFATVAISALLPPPVPLMPLLLGAGALKVSRRKFLLAFTLARGARYGLVTWVGVTYGRHVLRWWNQYLADYSSTILWTFLGLIVAGIAFGVWKYNHLEGRGARERRENGAQLASGD
jgi:membrane protein YqaA with SNARE-associated domain